MVCRWSWGLSVGLAAMLAGAAVTIRPQTIDSAAVPANRSATSITDQIRDPAERAAFAKLLKTTNPQQSLALSRAYLNRFPQSSFLATVEDRAARASFDVGDLQGGLAHARVSLQILPENPLLLIAVADVEAQLGMNDSAIAAARDALDDLDRFDRPASISARQWPSIKQRQQTIAWFAMGRALVNESLSSGAAGQPALLEQGIAALRKARDLDPDDTETLYLLGLAWRAGNNLPQAVLALSQVDDRGKEFAPQAHAALEAMYRASDPAAHVTLQDFVTGQKQQAINAATPDAPARKEPPAPLGPYAGSQACARCHAAEFRQWKQSGMARMLRPYEPQNVIGDFVTNNTFYTGDEISYLDGKLRITPGPARSLFARMTIRHGRHYFEIRQSDGLWHSYPVDYTIGSKWQQAYATRLANGQIHVFPIQYNVAEKRWLNYWKLIDGGNSERSNPLSWEKLDASTNYMINCAVCHTSQLHNSTGGGFDENNLAFREPGIDCEMCHGPSARHIEAVTSGKYLHQDPLDPPVDFHRVTNRQFVAICSQCHMQSNLHQESARGDLNDSPAGRFFRINHELPLDEYTRDTFFKDGRFRQTTFIAEALERSQCFRRGRVSCGTCHDPHGADVASNPTSLKFRKNSDLMCTGCHTQFQSQAAAGAHTHHPYTSEASRCVSCHMPRIMDALLFRARSHQIDGIPNAAMTARFGQQDSPNACLLCHTDKSVQWLQAQLASWK